MLNDIFNEYFLKPFVEHTGYNFVNTATYVLIALFSLYLIYSYIKKNKIKLDNKFVYSLISFIFFGSILRAFTDSIDTGKFLPITPIHEFVLNSHLYDYGFFTVTPGIYILVASLFLISYFYIEKKIKNFSIYFPTFLFLSHFLILLPFMHYAIYAIPVFLLAIIPAILSYNKIKELSLAVFAQSLDGAATFFVIDIFSKISNISYFEQHPLSRFIGSLFGTYFTFYLLKAILSFLIMYYIKDEKPLDKTFIFAIVLTIGLAPGLRDTFRMMMGA